MIQGNEMSLYRREMTGMCFNHYFNHQSIAWIASSPFSHKVSVFEKILKAATDNVKMTRDVLRSFVTAYACFDIPSAYKAFDEDYMQLLISVADIMCAARCYQIENELPYSLKNVNYEAFPVEKRFSPFLIRVFTKKTPPFLSTKTHLVFPDYQQIVQNEDPNPVFERIYRQIATDSKTQNVYNIVINANKTSTSKYKSEVIKTKEFIDFCRITTLNKLVSASDAFENYLLYKVCYDTLKDWNEIATKRQLALMTPMALKAAKTAIAYYPSNIGKAYARASHCFVSDELKKLQFYTIVIPSIMQCLESKSNLFQELESEWDGLLKEAILNMDAQTMNSLPHASGYIFWESVEEIRSIARIVPSRQFDLLIQAIKKLYIIAIHEEQLAKLAIIFSENVKLPAICLLSNEYIVASPVFQNLLDEHTMNVWERFNSVIHKFIRGTPTGELYEYIRGQLNGASSAMNHSDSDSSSSWFFGSKASDFYRLSTSE